MQRQTTLSIWCERLIEAGWLAALSLIPIYFNLLSARHFEPDKATTLRALVLLMAGLGIIRVLEMMNLGSSSGSSGSSGGSGGTGGSGGSGGTDTDQPAASNPFVVLWSRLTTVPLLVPALVYALVFIFSTVTSVVTHTSFWGSYQRLQGTYTNLSYIGLFLILIATMRRREQLERLIVVTLLTGLAVAGYGVLQHLQLDPLPWRGDVITRVASTMGNSIFVAAYLIMVVPLALYKAIVNANNARNGTEAGPTNPRNDLLWALAYGLLVFGTLALLLAVIKFGAVVRTVDFRYWWVFPGAIIVSTALWTLLTLRPPENGLGVPLWPGGLFLLYLLIFGPTYGVSAAAENAQVIDENMTNGLDWWAWMLASIAAIGGFYGLGLWLPRRPALPSRLTLWLQTAGTLFVTGTILVAIVFTQSRGPFLGLGAGLFVFFLLLLLTGMKRAKQLEQPALLRNLRMLLGGWIAVTVAAGLFLVVFNTTYNPFFNELRTWPYIGRMGQLLVTEYGTGRVRTLIWAGDEHAGGAIELITHDPVRTLIGWGPESMFVAYNPFYPPSLAEVESRGASPDRSHQAILDELVTKGFLGLISYFFLLISFVTLCWRLLRQSHEWHWKVFFIACLSIITSHFVEGLTGIPIVSTLMMLWVTLGITVTGGQMAGHYYIGRAEKPETEAERAEREAAEQAAAEEAEAAEAAKTGKKPRKRSRRRSESARSGGGSTGRGSRSGAATRRSSAGSSPQTSMAAIAFYAVFLALILTGVWWFNLSTVYADMRFHEGQAFSERPDSGLNEQLIAADKFIETINSNPREDFYYLNLGRTLMTIAQQQRAQGMPAGDDNPDVDLDDLLSIETTQDLAAFVQRTPPLEMMSYAEAVLKRARELNPMNKDHYANLARLNNFWYNWTQDPERLRISSDWYAQANEVAPQDVTLINEHASVLMILGSHLASQGKNDEAQQYYAQAEELLERSWALDKTYYDTPGRLAEAYRLSGQLAAATDLYIEVLERDPRGLDPFIERIIASLEGHPDLLMKLYDAYAVHGDEESSAFLYSIAGILAVRAGELEAAVDAYEQATTLNPNNLEFVRNYTIVLSDTNRFDRALGQAQAGLELARSREDAQTEIAQFQYLVNLLQPKVAGGE